MPMQHAKATKPKTKPPIAFRTYLRNQKVVEWLNQLCEADRRTPPEQLAHLIDEEAKRRGWVTTVATTAAALVLCALTLGRHHPEALACAPWLSGQFTRGELFKPWSRYSTTEKTVVVLAAISTAIALAL